MLFSPLQQVMTILPFIILGDWSAVHMRTLPTLSISAQEVVSSLKTATKKPVSASKSIAVPAEAKNTNLLDQHVDKKLEENDEENESIDEGIIVTDDTSAKGEKGKKVEGELTEAMAAETETDAGSQRKPPARSLKQSADDSLPGQRQNTGSKAQSSPTTKDSVDEVRSQQSVTSRTQAKSPSVVENPLASNQAAESIKEMNPAISGETNSNGGSQTKSPPPLASDGGSQARSPPPPASDGGSQVKSPPPPASPTLNNEAQQNMIKLGKKLEEVERERAETQSQRQPQPAKSKTETLSPKSGPPLSTSDRPSQAFSLVGKPAGDESRRKEEPLASSHTPASTGGNTNGSPTKHIDVHIGRIAGVEERIDVSSALAEDSQLKKVRNSTSSNQLIVNREST